MKIKGKISIGYSNASRSFEIELEDIGFDAESWNELDEKERDEILDEVLETEINNVLDANIWIE